MKKYTPAFLAALANEGRSRNRSEWYDSDYDQKCERRSYYVPHPEPPPIKVGYPFFPVEDGLLKFILDLVERHMTSYGDTKAEIAQEMALAVLSGLYTREQLANSVEDFIAQKFRKFSIGLNHNLVSLDELLDDDGEVTLIDVLDLKEKMTELKTEDNEQRQDCYNGYPYMPIPDREAMSKEEADLERPFRKYRENKNQELPVATKTAFGFKYGLIQNKPA